MSSEVKQILDEIECQRQELLRDCEDVYIVNAGRMNHGKSSLFNALLDRETYKVADVRQTVENQREAYQDHVYFVDTPGLDANAADDAEAYSIYKKANFIIYVHNPRIGELHKQEIDHIARLADVLTPEFFWSHFAIVMTFAEEFTGGGEQAMEEILQQVRGALQQRFSGVEAKIFCVSNALYGKAAKLKDERKKSIFLQKSHIPELRGFIDAHIPEWQQENVALQEGRFTRIREGALARLGTLRAQAEHKQAKRQQKFNARKQRVSDGFEEAIDNLAQYTDQLWMEKETVKRLLKETLRLKEQHRSEYF